MLLPFSRFPVFPFSRFQFQIDVFCPVATTTPALENMRGVLRDGGLCYIDYLHVKNDYSYQLYKRVDGFGEFQHNGQTYISFRTLHFDEANRWITFTYYFGRDDGKGRIESWIDPVVVAGRPILTDELRDLAIAAGFPHVRTKGVKRLGVFAEFNAILAINGKEKIGHEKAGV